MYVVLGGVSSGSSYAGLEGRCGYGDEDTGRQEMDAVTGTRMRQAGPVFLELSLVGQPDPDAVRAICRYLLHASRLSKRAAPKGRREMAHRDTEDDAGI